MIGEPKFSGSPGHEFKVGFKLSFATTKISNPPNPGWPSEAKNKSPLDPIVGNNSLAGVLILGPKFLTSDNSYIFFFLLYTKLTDHKSLPPNDLIPLISDASDANINIFSSFVTHG